MIKVATILSAICAIVGVPWAGLVWLSGAMKSVPGLDVGDLWWGLPLRALAVLIGGVSVALSVASKPKRKVSALVSTVAVVISLLAIGVLLMTYYDMQRKRTAPEPNKITGANAGGRHHLPDRMLLAARIAQFRRWATRWATSESGGSV